MAWRGNFKYPGNLCFCMLNEKQIREIREHLEKAQNPVFYFDNDADGLCSFVLLRKYIDRGKGVAVRSFPDLNASYARKAQELNADYVFVLDKPVLSKEFVEEVDKLGLPLVWIDHHDLPVDDFEKSFGNLFVYNPARGSNGGESEPVTFMSYQVSQRKEDMWLAVTGSIADHYLPDFVDEFGEKWPDFWGDNIDRPFDAYFKTEIGRIARALNFGLKDSVTNVVRLQNFLISCRNPVDVFLESPNNYAFRKKCEDVGKKYHELLERAKRFSGGRLIFFDYGGELSISSDLANELSYLYPKKYIAVVYKNGGISNLSLRGKGVKKILERVLKEVGGSGGGHEDAVGGRIKTEDLEKFKSVLEREIVK